MECNTIRIAGTEPESIVDGTGLRYVVFTQGCPHHCDGCHNPETWDLAGGRIVNIDDLISEIRSDPLLTGVTISGGEPFLQPDAVRALTSASHALGLTVWIYTGFTLEALREANNAVIDDILRDVDVLVDGRYMKDLRSLDLTFRGSSNQRIIDMKGEQNL